MQNDKVLLSKTPFRVSLGGGSTDLPSYYEKYGGFIFAFAVKMYMRILISTPVTDDNVHMQYLKYESQPSADLIKHDIGKKALEMMGIKNNIFISFHSDTPAGTGLGSSGACSVGLLKGLSLYVGNELSNLESAEKSFSLTQSIGLPDGKQDPYVCALGGFVILDISSDGDVSVRRPYIDSAVSDAFFAQTLFLYTNRTRESTSLLAKQSGEKVLALKHITKEIGKEIVTCFESGDLDRFGKLTHEHWRIKREMPDTTDPWIDSVYEKAYAAGALGGKIIGAGGGGYFMFYCPSVKKKEAVLKVLEKFSLRTIDFTLDTVGARTQMLNV